ncbi:molybdopterin-dependent oxidoreductase [Denitrobaculum tricleocarpae]|uniref:Molybdopterin-dependent oxidoreductase n=1 Tax=Denitrobaculum tricleocarpae TaxID=2591009 RepID=A0A545T800_9PROT|nr:molybdopterin cofactor-binding domain-containing protein [Denitrobaculum tricleocarpae]TQV73354.1 molybdopterin-dependent oxidoreductase [Denitrobaculum tricleocarpae]
MNVVLSFSLNGEPTRLEAPPAERLTKLLRERLGKTGTKVGCDAGDCGACTVLIDGEPVCACMTASAQVEGRAVTTIEGLAANGALSKLQQSMLHHGAAQCGICTPGIIVSAAALLEKTPKPSEEEVKDALGGVLCRCTGYRKIISAVMEASDFAIAPLRSNSGAAVGARLNRVDGEAKVRGTEIFGADTGLSESLLIRVIRSPHHRAAFIFHDLEAYVSSHPGVEMVLTAADVPGKNNFGVIPPFADQPVFAENETRFRGEAVAAVVGTPTAIEGLDLEDFPVEWQELPHSLTPEDALAESAPQLHPNRPGNRMAVGRVRCGDIAAGFDAAAASVEGSFSTGYIEHAYIEPEAGMARRIGDRLEIEVCTQAPYMNRDEIAAILNVAPEQVRVIPTAVGGGFGSKLDLSTHPFLAIAAWKLGRPVRMVYTRGESMASTTKRHPSQITAKIGATRDGKLCAMKFDGIFNTGAYASWGPTVANRVPVHASGPYRIPNYEAVAQGIHSNGPVSGAFRGFGVPQSAIAQESLFDELADELAMDRLEFRIINALENGVPTVTGQVFGQGCGAKKCLEALRSRWRDARDKAAACNADPRNAGLKRGVGLSGLWYGCGNTSLPNPSTIQVGLKADGRLVLFNGAVDIGQGANTVIAQICADAIGLPVEAMDFVNDDTDLTSDAGKTSASRQTFISGKAAFLAGESLREKLLRFANVSSDARLWLDGDHLLADDDDGSHRIALSGLASDGEGFVAMGEGTFDPPTSPLDENGQGEPYAAYGYGAQMMELEVDEALGTVKLIKLTAVHDVGRAINPTLIEGQIEGGSAQGIGLALMEEFIPGRSENLHDYLIPTIGDIPQIESVVLEEPDLHGPYGAKGLGEHVLVATAPAILNAIRDATGASIRNLPATPDKVHAALRAREKKQVSNGSG